MTHIDPVAAARARVAEIDVPALDAALAEGAVVIDVREPDEFAEDAIPGAVNIPLGVLEIAVSDEPEDLGRTAPVELADPSVPIYLYCRSGGRSALAAAFLEDRDYARVYSLAGGILAWRAEHPLPG
jgi:rhodanese-related sulfurtransferase